MKGDDRYFRSDCDLIRSLMQAPRTVNELLDLVSMAPDHLRKKLRVMRDNGLLFTARDLRMKGPDTRGHLPEVWHWCPVPFETPASALDAVPPMTTEQIFREISRGRTQASVAKEARIRVDALRQKLRRAGLPPSAQAILEQTNGAAHE